jgi:hypothetical protein
MTSDKLTVGPNNGEILYPEDIHLNDMSKTSARFGEDDDYTDAQSTIKNQHIGGQLMFEDDPRLFICTCSKNCYKVNPSCNCRTIPDKGWNVEVHDNILKM